MTFAERYARRIVNLKKAMRWVNPTEKRRIRAMIRDYERDIQIWEIKQRKVRA